MNKLIFSLFLILTQASFAHAPQEIYNINPSAVHPTQFAVGMREVLSKRDELARLVPPLLEKHFRKNPLSCVIGPDGDCYLTDGHHEAYAALLLSATSHPALIVEDLHELSWEAFWAHMKQNNSVYLYDENGQGPLAVEELPRTLTQMRDDPYRSLAQAVRKAGGYAATNINYADFAWANFFRTRIPRDLLGADFDAAVEQGISLAKSAAAEGLPGFTG